MIGLLLIPVLFWCGLRAGSARGKRWFEWPATARNRNMGRRHDPPFVQAVTVIVMIVLLVVVFRGRA